MTSSAPASSPSPDAPILIVDDSMVARLSLRARLEAWGRPTLTASSVAHALDILEREPVRLVFSDWEMPERDGLDLCAEIRSRSHRPGYTYVIMLSGRHGAEEVSTALRAGADEFLTKPVASGELLARLSAAERITEMSDRLARQNQTLADVNERMQAMLDALDRDLRLAQRLQSALLPSEAASWPGIELAHVYHPCGHIGGDLLGYRLIGPNMLFAFSLDVSGHGIASALLSVELAQLLGREADRFDDHRPRDRACQLPDPAHVAARLNRWMCDNERDGHYFTMALVTLDLVSGQGRLCQAGHPPPLFLPADGEPRCTGQPQSPIGLFRHMMFVSTELSLAPGDRLVLYTDGLSEMEDGDGRQLGTQGLIEAFDGHAEKPPLAALRTMVSRVSERSRHGDDETISDDLSALMLCRPNGASG